MTGGRRTDSLHAMLGLPPDASPALIRSTYEQQVNAAVRGGDTRRAIALSRAFDDLPLLERRQLYAGAGSLAPRFAEDPPRVRPPARRRRRRRIGTRVVVYALVVPAAVVLGVAVMLHVDPRVPGSWTSPRASPPSAVVATVATTAVGPWWQVPADAPVGVDGRVAVWCHDSSGNGQTSRLEPGQMFTCPGGETAVITSS